ncbi:MAG: sensor histidine kinase [Chloroflexaceae bacterium]|nr:sensor histidine kinase [Chloroflexaceae bacterium]
MTTTEEMDQAKDVYQDELDRLQRELHELDITVRQQEADVEKLASREVSVSNRLRDLDVNYEKYSKAEIKNFYTNAQEVQMRLYSMRARLEQLRDRQKTMKERYELIEEFMDLLGGVGTTAQRGSDQNGVPEQLVAQSGDDLIVNIIQAQEEERRRISLQMHDGPAQSMANLVLRAEICQRLLEKDVGQARTELTGLKTSINTMLQDIRKFVFDLHPMTLEDLGLVPTVRRFASEFGEKNGIEVNIMVNGLESRMPGYYEVTLFRFIQEALNNIAKHAGANQARVLMNVSENTLQIIVEDDGEGFHVNEVLADTSGRRNLGISSMRQQIEVLLKGEFGIESAIGRGTRVAATVNLP